MKWNAISKDPYTLSAIGNLYYDAQQYSTAVDYYSRARQSRPSDASVRTDMATAYWYMGNSEEAIAQFNKALVDAPTNPNTLFNLGLVKWKARHDSAGAIADWKKLLEANPTMSSATRSVRCSLIWKSKPQPKLLPRAD